MEAGEGVGGGGQELVKWDTLTVELNPKWSGFRREMVRWTVPGYPNIRVPKSQETGRAVAF